MAPLAALLAPLLAASVVLEGSAHCPTPEAVSRNLAELLPASPQISVVGPAARRARLTAGPDGVRVQLRDPGGRLLADRSLPRGGASCEELARAAALVVAAWDRALASGVALALPAGAAAEPAAEVAVRGAPSGPGRRPVRFDVGAALLASLAGPAFAPGAMITTHVLPSRLPLGLRVGLVGASTRSVRLGSGEVAWTRMAVALGPHLRLTRRRWVLDGHAEALVGAAYAGGSGYTEDRSGMSFDAGLGGGLRLGYRTGRGGRAGVLPFVGASVAGWPQVQRLRVLGSNETGQMGRLEVLFTGGVAFGRF